MLSSLTAVCGAPPVTLPQINSSASPTGTGFTAVCSAPPATDRLTAVLHLPAQDLLLFLHQPQIDSSPILEVSCVTSIRGQNHVKIVLSFPYDGTNSGYDGIARENVSVKYLSLMDAISVVKQLGVGTHMVKMDIKSALRLMPICPERYCLFSGMMIGKSNVP